jgi:peptide/nickel transport system substrate-binding protein
MKTMRSFLAILLMLCLYSCGDKSKPGSRPLSAMHGGTVRLNEIENFKSLFPVSISEITNYHIATQLYEGLVRYDEELNLIPALARSWEADSSLTKYTFHIRNDVYFHNDPCFTDTVGRAVVASDIRYCFENLCVKGSHNSQFEVTFRDRVLGANEYYAASLKEKNKELKGITVLDDSTLTITLTQPDANFLNVLAMPGCFIYPREAYEKYGSDMRSHCVGTGPFYLAVVNEGLELLMLRNNRYWGVDKKGNSLPYLDSIHWSFIRDKKTEVSEFKNGKLDMIYRIPMDLFNEMFGPYDNKKNISFELYSSPALSTNYYGFNLQTNPFFSIKEIRQALNLAIDREKIAKEVIRGEGEPARYGIVPFTEVFQRKGYDYKSLKAFKYDPDSARKLLASVGYPKGAGLPPFNLEINSGGGERNLMVAVAIQKMLQQNIGVRVNLSIVTWPEHIENVQTGKIDFFRYAWVSDYADPESFLGIFYGKHVPENYLERSYINLVRFKNKDFDSLFMAAKLEPDERKRYKLFSKAEQVMLDEAPFMPLFYDENLRLVQKHVKNLKENPLNYVDLRTTYLEPGYRKKSH